MSFGETFEASTGVFEPVAQGRYSAILNNATLEETKEKKTPYINMAFTINDGGDFDGRKLWVKLWFTEGAYNMTSQQLSNILVFDAIGKHETIQGFQDAAADKVFALINKKFEVSVTGHDEFKGKQYEKTFLTHFLDTPNAAFQSVTNDAANAGVNVVASTLEDLPF